MSRLDPLTGLKECCKCKVKKPISDFASNRSKPDGTTYECRPCLSIFRKDSAKRYRVKHAEKRRAWNREYMKRKLLDPEFKERQRASFRAYYHKNKVRLIANRMAYAKFNPLGRAAAFIHAYRRNKWKAHNPELTARKLHKMFLASNHLCFYCGVTLDKKYEYDHHFPLSRGGDHSVENLRLSCVKCNRLKRDMMPDEFILKYIEVGYPFAII